jgi:hypothetical protein
MGEITALEKAVTEHCAALSESLPDNRIGLVASLPGLGVERAQSPIKLLFSHRDAVRFTLAAELLRFFAVVHNLEGAERDVAADQPPTSGTACARVASPETLDELDHEVTSSVLHGNATAAYGFSLCSVRQASWIWKYSD